MKNYEEGLRDRGMSRRRPGGASWVTFAVLILLFVGGLASARSMGPAAALVTVAALFGLLAVVGSLWGADSSDGADWTRKPDAIR